MLKSRKLWVKALRSGKYKQCHGQYSDGKGGYCCLGVAQEVAKAHGLKFKEATGTDPFPDALSEWFDLKEGAGDFSDGADLARCNDGVHYGPHTFDDIAFLIENLP